MIVVDTSALMEMLLLGPRAADCKRAVALQSELAISAGTLAEAFIVAGRRGIADKMEKLVDSLPLEVVPVTAATARRVAEAYARWGKGVHPAGLNLGDCFAYEAADTHACPLLFIGNDFVRTDIRRGSDAWAHDRRTPCFCTAAPQVLTIGNSLFSDS